MSVNVQVTKAWHTAGAAKALTAAYVDGDIVQPCRPANRARVRCTLAWVVAPTSVRVKLYWTNDRSTYVPVSVINSVGLGIVYLGDGEFDLPVGTAGTHEIDVSIPPGKDLKMAAKMVDAGASNPTLLAFWNLSDD